MKIYTRTGDSGETGLFDGTRVVEVGRRASRRTATSTSSMPGSARVRACGRGRARSGRCSSRSSAICSRSAHASRIPAHRIAERVTKAAVGAEDIARLEGWIDALESELPPLRRFILAGGSPSRRRAARRADDLPARRARDGRARSATRLRAGAADRTSTACRTCCSSWRGAPTSAPGRPKSSGDRPGARGRLRAVCERLARAHYENFPVASQLLPPRMRPHIAAIYAFARTADDIADEAGHAGRRAARRLDDWDARLNRRRRSRRESSAREPHVRRSSSRCRTRSASAACRCRSFTICSARFARTSSRKRYATWDEVLDYCRRSANPVGRLVLRRRRATDAGARRRDRTPSARRCS